MTIETVIIICVAAAFCCYLVYRWQKAVVDMAIPPYQEPVKPDMVEQWVAATKADTLDNIDNWNAKVGDKIWHKPEPNPANWPFPTSQKP